jgi:hypothetical protein
MSLVSDLEEEIAAVDWRAIVNYLCHDMLERTDYNAFFTSFLFEQRHAAWGGLLSLRGGGPAVAAMMHARIAELHAWEAANCAKRLADCAADLVAVGDDDYDDHGRGHGGGGGVAGGVGDFGTERAIFALQGVAQALYYTQYFEDGRSWGCKDGPACGCRNLRPSGTGAAAAAAAAAALAAAGGGGVARSSSGDDDEDSGDGGRESSGGLKMENSPNPATLMSTKLGSSPSSSRSSGLQKRACREHLAAQLVPHLDAFVLASAARAAERPPHEQAAKLSVALACVNTVTLFAPATGALDDAQLSRALALLKHTFGARNPGGLNLYSKVAVLTHIGLNCKGRVGLPHLGWIFDFFDAAEPQLLGAFEDWSNTNRDITLDLVAEIVTCYRFSRHATPALRRYVAFVRHEVARKYSGVGYRFRFYAHADLASDHEAVSLYHAFLAQWQTNT